uniref:Fibromodulin n=1 Tax=Homo sapiens TaxID=9606 RepID=B3KYB3_HUMAN|nr:unnamed protein product [Homo sapiens]
MKMTLIGGSTTSAASSPPTTIPMTLTRMRPTSLTPMGWMKGQPTPTALHLDHNQISRVPNNALEGLENLTAMYCDNRNLKYLPFVPSRMKYVYFQNNQITSIQEGVFDNATGLLWIALHGNQITSDKVGRKVFSKLRHLERLYLDHNNLTRMPGPLPRSLRELHLDHNQIPATAPRNATAHPTSPRPCTSNTMRSRKWAVP